MPELTSFIYSPAGVSRDSLATAPAADAGARAAVYPNVFVRWAFYLSIFTMPFSYIYIPGTGGHLGVVRIGQALILCAFLSQPRVCLRLVPLTLFWFLAYITLRIVLGLCLTPNAASMWWPSSREFIEDLPWFWMMFNLLQFPRMRRNGLWAFGLGFSLCAICHILGLGVTAVNAYGDRSTIFGMNANDLGASYAAAMIALLGLWTLHPRTTIQRYLPFPLMALMGIAMAKTASRTAIVVFVIGVFILFFMGKSHISKVKRILSLGLAAIALGLILWQIPIVMERFAELNPHNLGENNPRARMAPVLWNLFLRSPVYGLGPDGYEYPLTRGAMPYLIDDGKLIDSHNLVLMLLVETGITGFFLYAMGVWPALVAAWKGRLNPICGPLPLALLLPFVIGAFTVSNPMHGMAFWVTLAYGLIGAV